MGELISVIMCTYNESREELELAIQSVLNQTYRNFELLIVLDNPDNHMIRDVVGGYAGEDSRIKVIFNERNLGVAFSSNRALAIAEGVYVAKMDADDIAFEQRLERELEELEAYELDMVAASKVNVDEAGQNLGDFINCLDMAQLRGLLPYDNLITQSTVLMKKSVAEAMGGYLPLPSCEDYDLWLRMLCKGYRMAVIPDVLVYYRVRRNSITRTDYYKQYLSDRFVRAMYRVHKKDGTLWSLADYDRYMERVRPTEQKKERFNRSYGIYYSAMEARRAGAYGKCLAGVFLSVFSSPEVLGVLVRKVLFHIRKKAVGYK